MDRHNTLSFTFDDERTAAEFNGWFARFLGRLDSRGVPMEAAYLKTLIENGGVTKRIEFESATDMYRAMKADIAGQVAALKRSMVQCASC